MIVWAVMIPLFVWVSVRNISHWRDRVGRRPHQGDRRLGVDHYGAAVRRRHRDDLLRLYPGLHRDLRLLRAPNRTEVTVKANARAEH